MVITDLDQLQRIFRVGVLEPQIKNTARVHVLDQFLHTFVVHEAATWVSQGLLVIATLWQMCWEPIQLLDVNVVNAPLVLPSVAFDELVVFLVLVLFFGESVVVELFFVHVVD